MIIQVDFILGNSTHLAVVKVEIKYQKSEITDVEIEATSPVQKLVDGLRSHFNIAGTKWRLESRNVLLKYGGLEVEDRSQPVVNFFPLHLPFFFGKYVMHA